MQKITEEEQVILDYAELWGKYVKSYDLIRTDPENSFAHKSRVYELRRELVTMRSSRGWWHDPATTASLLETAAQIRAKHPELSKKQT